MNLIDYHFKSMLSLNLYSSQRSFVEWMYVNGDHVTVQSLEGFPEIRDRFLHYRWTLDLEQKQCFRNAYRSTVLFDDFLYVEGWAAIHGKLVEHAWIAYEGPQGRVFFDPTFELVLALEVERSYFAVIILDQEQAHRSNRETAMYGGWMMYQFRQG